MYKDKVILITGGSGSWGNELVTQLLGKNPRKIIVFSRGELAQVNMQRKFQDNRIEFVIGDVRDYESVNKVCKDVDIVFHLAALKHVPICENQPQEAIKTNINGTTNLINACVANKVKKFIDVSTDKAVSPTNLYGMTKSVGEKITIQANKLTDTTDFVCIRGGNVLGSNGSVVPYFINQIKTENKVTITDKTMSRFFLTLSEAISILFQAVEFSVGGETYVMNMPSFYISDLAKVLVKFYGDENTKIEEIGVREGEKIDELLISEYESKLTYVFNNDYYVILPEIKIDRDYSHIDKYKKVKFKSFSSVDNIKDEEYLFKLLMNGGFLKK
jgi:UDP-N-acetylglucosamine 4,6-dehydratase